MQTYNVRLVRGPLPPLALWDRTTCSGKGGGEVQVSTDTLKLEVRIGLSSVFVTVSVPLSLSISLVARSIWRQNTSALEQGRNPSSLSSELLQSDSLSLSLSFYLFLSLPLSVSSAGSANCSQGWGAFVCHSRPTHSHLWVTGSSMTAPVFLFFVSVCVCFQSL